MLEGSTDPLRDLREALAGRPEIVVIDGLDAFAGGSEHDQAAAALRDAAVTTPALTVLASSTHVDAARALLSDAGWPEAPILDVSAASRPAYAADPTSALSTEVHA
jgi:RND superfamily putative drug exporter